MATRCSSQATDAHTAMRRTLSSIVLLAPCSASFVSCAESPIPVPGAESPITVSAIPGTGVILSQDTTHYQVTGTSVRELRASIATRAPLAKDRRRYGGFTTWNVRYTYASSGTAPDGCSPNGVTVYLDLSVRYPVWRDSAAARGSVRKEWNRYVTALNAHEAQHAAIAIRGANRLASELRDLVSPFCSTLQADAQGLATEAAKSIRSDNDHYDERTRHGVTEGASLRDRTPWWR